MIFHPLYAGHGSGGGQIFQLNPSARSAAMGEAYTAVAGDVNSFLYNPAALARLEKNKAELSHMRYFLDTSMSSAGYAHSFSGKAVAVNIKHFSAEDTARSSLGHEKEKFNIDFSQYTAGAGFSLNEFHSAGLSVNIIREAIYGNADTAVSLDMGWHYMVNPEVSYGFALRNMGDKIGIYEDRAEIPLEAALAGAYTIENFFLSWEVSLSNRYGTSYRGGMHLRTAENFVIRGGLSYITRLDFMLGFGINIEQWVFDYAFIPHSALGNSHRFSVGYNF